MTEIKYSRNKSFNLQVCGHCAFSDGGNDIVCAAVSILTQTLAHKLSDLPQTLYKKPVKIEIEEALLTIKVTPKVEFYEQIKNYFDLTCHGLKLLSKTYPQNVKFL